MHRRPIDRMLHGAVVRFSAGMVCKGLEPLRQVVQVVPICCRVLCRLVLWVRQCTKAATSRIVTSSISGLGSLGLDQLCGMAHSRQPMSTPRTPSASSREAVLMHTTSTRADCAVWVQPGDDAGAFQLRVEVSGAGRREESKTYLKNSKAHAVQLAVCWFSCSLYPAFVAVPINVERDGSRAWIPRRPGISNGTR